MNERANRVWTNDEKCVLDDQRFFLYGSIELPIIKHEEVFLWGAWSEVTEEDFFAYQELGDLEGREAHAPIQGALATDIPFYPPTIGMPAAALIQPKSQRPLFALASGPHPLVHDHLEGVTAARIGEIARWFGALKSGHAA